MKAANAAKTAAEAEQEAGRAAVEKPIYINTRKKTCTNIT